MCSKTTNLDYRRDERHTAQPSHRVLIGNINHDETDILVCKKRMRLYTAQEIYSQVLTELTGTVPVLFGDSSGSRTVRTYINYSVSRTQG